MTAPARRPPWHCLLALALLLADARRAAFAYGQDCGSTEVRTINGVQWEGDRGFKAGTARTVANATGLSDVDATYRAFAPGENSCYTLLVASGRYFVYIEGVLLKIVNVSATSSAGGDADDARWTDYVVYVTDGAADICVLPGVDGASAYISSIEVLEVSEAAYASGTLGLGKGDLLANYVRINSGGGWLAPVHDPHARLWHGDVSPTEGQYKVLQTNHSITGASGPPNYLPLELFSDGRLAGASNVTSYVWSLDPVDASYDWLAMLYFAEVQPEVRLGSRLIDVHVNGRMIATIDILELAGGLHFAAASLPIVTSPTLATDEDPYNIIIQLSRNAHATHNPVIHGIELLEIIPASSTREDVEAELFTHRKKRLSQGALTGDCEGFAVDSDALPEWDFLKSSRDGFTILRPDVCALPDCASNRTFEVSLPGHSCAHMRARACQDAVWLCKAQLPPSSTAAQQVGDLVAAVGNSILPVDPGLDRRNLSPPGEQERPVWWLRSSQTSDLGPTAHAFAGCDFTSGIACLTLPGQQCCCLLHPFILFKAPPRPTTGIASLC
eukprot:SM000016S01910  [mRNA]  locus=s16:494923:497350:+ [translate_table: standard]